MIELINVSKTYSNGGVQTKALIDVSFKVADGEYLAITGPSGSGKSTLMHIIGALDAPTLGKYILDGKDVGKLKDDELSDIRNEKIGFIFQSYNLLPRFNTIKNVALPMYYAGISKKTRTITAKDMLTKVGLQDKFNNMPNQLSGGQKQRVAIARALTMNPTILLADEPTGNLPTTQSDEIIELFEQLNKQGHTVVVITHNDDIARRAKRIISIVDGKIKSDELN